MSRALAALLLSAAAVVLLLVSGASANFTCTGSTTTCTAAVDYVALNATNLTAIADRFQVPLASLFGANNFTRGSPPDRLVPVAAGESVKITFPCRCANGIGQSDHVPIYTVVANDGLDFIARSKFGQLLTYPDIVAANGIPDPNHIEIGQKLWIPLPCSCDDVDGERVMHYAYRVESGDTLAGIATEFSASSSTLMTLNGITDPKSLKEDQILDVPLKECSSSIDAGSPDHNLTLADGMYASTAGGCVLCRCNIATSHRMKCSYVPLMSNASCPAVSCNGSTAFGEETASGCAVTGCEYAGYSSTTPLKILARTFTDNANCKSWGSVWRAPWIASLVALLLSSLLTLCA